MSTTRRSKPSAEMPSERPAKRSRLSETSPEDGVVVAEDRDVPPDEQGTGDVAHSSTSLSTAALSLDLPEWVKADIASRLELVSDLQIISECKFAIAKVPKSAMWGPENDKDLSKFLCVNLQLLTVVYVGSIVSLWFQDRQGEPHQRANLGVVMLCKRDLKAAVRLPAQSKPVKVMKGDRVYAGKFMTQWVKGESKPRAVLFDEIFDLSEADSDKDDMTRRYPYNLGVGDLVVIEANVVRFKTGMDHRSWDEYGVNFELKNISILAEMPSGHQPLANVTRMSLSVFQTLIDHMDFPGLLAMRAVSKRLRHMVNRRLQRRVRSILAGFAPNVELLLFAMDENNMFIGGYHALSFFMVNNLSRALPLQLFVPIGRIARMVLHFAQLQHSDVIRTDDLSDRDRERVRALLPICRAPNTTMMCFVGTTIFGTPWPRITFDRRGLLGSIEMGPTSYATGLKSEDFDFKLYPWMWSTGDTDRGCKRHRYCCPAQCRRLDDQGALLARWEFASTRIPYTICFRLDQRPCDNACLLESEGLHSASDVVIVFQMNVQRNLSVSPLDDNTIVLDGIIGKSLLDRIRRLIDYKYEADHHYSLWTVPRDACWIGSEYRQVLSHDGQRITIRAIGNLRRCQFTCSNYGCQVSMELELLRGVDSDALNGLLQTRRSSSKLLELVHVLNGPTTIVFDRCLPFLRQMGLDGLAYGDLIMVDFTCAMVKNGAADTLMFCITNRINRVLYQNPSSPCGAAFELSLWQFLTKLGHFGQFKPGGVEEKRRILLPGRVKRPWIRPATPA
ncbi:hypothetical protein C8Q79DRAFT_1045280 [Trametes meyenii]|nr:hypothetical protein C8Q79DRAFT_1045280 [Trametes meyenii]